MRADGGFANRPRSGRGGAARGAWLWACVTLVLFAALPAGAFAHGVTEGDTGYIQETTGIQILPFVYLGAKHMVTG